MAGISVERIAAWIDRHRVGVLVCSLVVALAGGFLASRMPLEADLLALLPTSQPSVRDLREVRTRARPFGTVEIVIEARDVALRRRAADALSTRLAALAAARPDLIVSFSPDDGPRYRHGWQHRFLFADEADLAAVKDGLRARIDRARLAANPLYISLDDDPGPAADDGEAKLAELEDRLADVEAKATSPPPRVSKDGALELLLVQSSFAVLDVARGRALIDAVHAAIADVERELGPAASALRVGLGGNVTVTLHEHDSMTAGMRWSVILTVLLCAFALLFYYRSGRLVLAILWALAVGVAMTFAAAWALIGYFNVMTAFLTAIVIGNGINAGLILVARYLDEVRGGLAPRAAVGPAMAGALRGTLAAAGTAAVAYGSLLATDFSGFRQFGAIAAIGMVLTWLSTFTVLPATLCVFARRGWIRVSPPPAVGEALARVLPHRPRGMRATLAVAAALTLAAAVVATGYLAGDPFTHDWRDLQSRTPAIRASQALTERVKTAFDDKGTLSGQAYALVIALARREDAAPLLEALRQLDHDRPPERRWIHDVRGLDDLIPRDQPARRALLAELRALIDDPQLQAALTDDERARLARLRPPDDVRPVVDADVPAALAWPFIEKGGAIGRLLVLRGARRFNSFDVDDRLAFAAEAQRLRLPPGAVAAGESLVVADLIATMERDAPAMIGFALVGSILFVLIGLRGLGPITLACGLAGVAVMIAGCALIGLKVHFLDLIALPITIGIGIDYAVNLAARDRQDGHLGPQHLLRTTGGAVLLCSYTTAVGYGTLLLSPNQGIRAFGIAALLGEIACVGMALVVAPSWLALARARAARRGA